MKQLVRWMFFSNVIRDGEELNEIGWVGGLGVLSILAANDGVALAGSFNGPIPNEVIMSMIIGVVWMIVFAMMGFGPVGSIFIPAGFALMGYGFNTMPSAWALLEVILGFWLALRCFSIGPEIES